MDSGDFPHLDVSSDTQLLEPDMGRLRQERFTRNRAFLQSLNHSIAEKVMPREKGVCGSQSEEAAVCIQRHWRGYKGRQLYVEKLYEKFEQEEQEQHLKVLYQIEEGELLVENHTLEVLLEEGQTTRRNAKRRYLAYVITIQRAWRDYLLRSKQQQQKLQTQSDHNNSNNILTTASSAPVQNNSVVNFAVACVNFQEPDKDFQSDDESANTFVNPLACDKLTKGTEATIPSSESSGRTDRQSQRQSEPSARQDAEITRQQQKARVLAQAHEFAQLKKTNADALPLNLHLYLSRYQTQLGSDIQSNSSMSVGDPCLDSTVDVQSAMCNCDETGCSHLANHHTSGPDGCCGQDGCKCNKKQSDTSEWSASICQCGETQGGDSRENNELTDKNSSAEKGFRDNRDNNAQETIGGNSEIKGDNSGLCKLKSAGDRSMKDMETKGGNSKGSPDEELSAFDVYNIETAIPDIDWATLEQNLKAANEEARLIQEARRNDREEIRKKLAMGVDDDYYDDNDDDDDIRYKKPNLQSRLHSGLQICFMNESPCDTDSEGLSPRQLEIHDNLKAPSKDSEVDSDNNLRSVTDLNQVTSTSLAEGCGSVIPTAPVLKTSMVGVNSENFHSKQEQLQQEARMALAQAGSMAHMQLEIEKQAQKKSPMAEMVGIPGLGERRRKKLGIRKLQEMNLTSIQVLYNDLQTQIENLNEELVHLLMERDELHMEQDSMLVDIEDLTRRAEELAARKNYKDGKGNMKGKVSGR